ncbi:BON domain-containing protein [Peristeroidobacter agariperforans]|uniref:BON domain-containing protein n=1 Tax=Peristeroidobacter agariperforans TaxID=268404 RepID=UPI00101B7F54|nr:BON domain-containing protein [Peristeroidobacter agariperforans]
MSTQQSTREAITDGVITAKVRAALGEDPITARYDICVETLAGIVELSGFVDTEIVHIEALHVAEHVRGVLRVEDLLDVRNLG